MSEPPRPGRPEQPVPDPDSPIGRFALSLRALRSAAGTPTYTELAWESQRLGVRVAPTSLRNAAAGERLPTPRVLAAFVRACLNLRRQEGARPTENVDAAVEGWLTERDRLTGTVDTERGRADRVPGNLVSELSGFVGREHDIERLGALLGVARLVTLTGIGGVGKSRLARRVAEQVRPAHPDGVWMVELSPLTDPSTVVWTVAAELGLQEEGGDVENQLARALEHRRVLLILDNCEHLVDECARLTRSLLGTAPRLTVLATSRRSLGVEGEHLWPVEPFHITEDVAVLPLEQARTHPALCLLRQRIALVRRDFSLTEDNVAEAARLCASLDGIPLAIELAARRSRSLPLSLIRREVAAHHRLLSDGDRTAPPRHRSVGALLEWSHDLCTPDERLLWARMSVFAGPVTAEDIRGVVGYGDLDPERVLLTLHALVDQSIVSLVPGREGAYRLLDTVRSHGRARLGERAEAELRRRHRDWFVSRIHLVYNDLYSSRQTAALGLIDASYDDIRAALEYLCGPDGDPVDAQSATAGLWLYWMARGRLAEGHGWLTRALGRSVEPTYARCQALWGAGYLALLRGRPGESLELATRALGIADRLGDIDSREACRTLTLLALLFEERLRECVAIGHRLLAEPKLDRPTLMRQFTVAATGAAHALAGNTAAGLDLIHRAEELGREQGEVWHRSYNLWLLGVLLSRLDGRRAGAHLREALVLKQRTGDGLGLPAVVQTLAWHVFAHGDPERAAHILGASDALWNTGSPPMFRFVPMVRMGEEFRVRLRAELGEECFERWYRRGHELSPEETVALCLDTEPSTTRG